MMEYTAEQLHRMAVPCQPMVDALKQRPIPDMAGGDPDASLITIRKNRADFLAKLRHLYPIPSKPDSVKELYHTVKARDGYDIPIKITTPAKSSPQKSPLVVLYHEGGWCVGDFTDEDHDAWQFSRDLNAVCEDISGRRRAVAIGNVPAEAFLLLRATRLLRIVDIVSLGVL